LTPFLSLIQIIISAALIVLILLQTKGSALGSMFGGTDGGVYKTKRGVEKTLFNLTIALSLVFFIVAILNVISAG
jgi:preprotein translocase subunit SecG